MTQQTPQQTPPASDAANPRQVPRQKYAPVPGKSLRATDQSVRSETASHAPAHARPAINPDLAELARRGATNSTPDHQLDLQHETSLAPVARAQTVPWTDWELRTVLNHRLREACGSGHPPRNVRAWLAAAKFDELDNEHQKPGWIRKAAAGITAAADGKRITGWRWERGTHAGTFIRDPYGTDTPPRGYA